jgi:hypothetical protein
MLSGFALPSHLSYNLPFFQLDERLTGLSNFMLPFSTLGRNLKSQYRL